MNEARPIQIERAFVYWILGFLIAAIYEFAGLVLFFQKSWTASNAFARFIPNSLAVIIVAALSGLIYVILLRILIKRTTLLIPTIAVSLAAFAAIPVAYHVYALLEEQPKWIGWLVSIVSGLISYAVIFAILRALILIARRQRRTASLFLFILLFPIFLLIGTILYNGRSQEVSNGSIRHIILISIDTLRHDYVSAYAPQNVSTPVLDQIAREGARFEVAVAPVPQTGPSHISMLTGLSPLDHGILLNSQPLPRHAKTIANQLRDAGFQTGGFVSGFPLKDFNCNLQTGFGVYDDAMALNDRFRDLFYGRLLGSLPFFRWGVYRQAQEVTEPALAWLEKNQDVPFFLFLHYYDPHYPYGIKPQRRRFKRPMYVRIPKSDVVNQKRLYAQEVRSVDHQIGRVIDFLKSSGIYDETLLIVTADHGESLGEHDFFYSHERYIYEQMIRVPLILRCPDRIRPGTVFPKQVAMLDVYKTIASAAGIVPLPGNRGFDLIQLIQSDPATYERILFSYHFAYEVEGVRSEKWKLIRNGKAKVKSQRYELYDLETDPGETINRFETEPEIAQKLMAHLSLKSQLRKEGQDLTEEQIEVLRSLGYIQ